MSKISFSVYKPILQTRAAWRLDIGCFLMRMFTFLSAVGIVSMLTLLGTSAFIAGTVSTVMGLSMFLIAPRVSRKIDQLGQSKVMPWAVLVAMLGLIMMLVVGVLQLPFWLYYIAAVLIGFGPHASSLARTRWTYLVRACQDKFDLKNLTIKEVMSWEGILDDVGFTIAPMLCIALNAGIHPIAGMSFGGLCYIIGTVLLLSSKETEPIPGWGEETVPGSDGKKTRSVFFISAAVRVVFLGFLCEGLLFGFMDASLVTFAEELHMPNFAGVTLAVASVISCVSGILFGALMLKAKQYKQQVISTVIFGLAYSLLFFIFNAPSCAIIICFAAFWYPPFVIISNTTVEHGVDGSRLTEAITLTSAGLTVGMAIGPTLSGWTVDTFGGLIGIKSVVIFGIITILLGLLCTGVLKRNVRDE